MQNICDEFVCALRKRVLLQGRLYICEHFICFHSNLFGYNKEKVVPLKVTPSPLPVLACTIDQPQGRSPRMPAVMPQQMHESYCIRCKQTCSLPRLGSAELHLSV